MNLSEHTHVPQLLSVTAMFSALKLKTQAKINIYQQHHLITINSSMAS